MAPRKNRPSSPDEIQRKNLERKRQALEAVNLPPEIAELLSGAGIEVTRAGEKREGRTVENNSARRLDMIEAVRSLLKKRECGGCYDALRRMERDILVRRGEGDRGRVMERVDGQEGRDIVDRIVQAGKDLDSIQGRVSRVDWWLLSELIAPTRPHNGWQDAVFYVTGEENAHARAGRVRGAAVNLRDAYDVMERVRLERRKAAA